MNTSELTKYIVEGLLGEEAKKDIALYAGAFRPPTKSDYDLLLKALEDNPGLDEIHVFVGDSKSEGLDQDDSVAIWKMFGEHFPRDLYVHKSAESPVKDVYGYVSKFPTYDFSWLFGVQAGNDNDFKEISDRTKSVGKFDNLEISPVVYDQKITDREVAAAANMGRDELEKYLPDSLTYKEVDDIYNMLKPQQLNEGVFDTTEDVINKIVEGGYEWSPWIMDTTREQQERLLSRAQSKKKKFVTAAMGLHGRIVVIFASDELTNRTSPSQSPSRSWVDNIEGATEQDLEDIEDAGKFHMSEFKQINEEIYSYPDDILDKIANEGWEYFDTIGSFLSDSAAKVKSAANRDKKKYFTLVYEKDSSSDIQYLNIFWSDKGGGPKRDVIEGGTMQDYEDMIDAAEAIVVKEVADADQAKLEEVIEKIVETNAQHFFFPSNPIRYTNNEMVQILQDKEKETGRPRFAILKYANGVVIHFSDGTIFTLDVEDQDITDILDAADANKINEVADADLGKWEDLLNRLAEEGYDYYPATRIDVHGSIDHPATGMKRVFRDLSRELKKPLFTYTEEVTGSELGFNREFENRSLDVYLAHPDKREVEVIRIHNTDQDDVEILQDLDESVIKEATNQPRFEELLNKIAEGDYYFQKTKSNNVGHLKNVHKFIKDDLKFDKPFFISTAERSDTTDTAFMFSDDPENIFWIADMTEEDKEIINDTIQTFTKDLNKAIDSRVNESIEFEYDPVHEMAHYEDLMRYMSDNGLKIKPYPEIVFVDDDEENGEDLFGKTAYYDPNSRKVVLYTYGRHPKDILRSFAHELIHVHQDAEGRIGNIQTTNTNADEDLVELEKEAYLKGNIMFRQWTDGIDEDKKKDYGVQAYAAELARLREGKQLTKKDFLKYLRKNFVNG